MTSPAAAARRSRLDETIVAVSSPPGRAGRGLIRLTGPGVEAILSALLAPGETLPEPQRLTPARLRLDTDASTPLPCLLSRAEGPRSFTGQDLAEVQTPGHPALLERVTRAMLRHGARRAEPGEFTYRAFVNRKLDLTRAEGVAATIAAVSDAQLRAAGMLRQGRLGTLATSLVDRVANLLALVEAGIDFTDQDDVVPIAPRVLYQRTLELRNELRDTLRRSASWASLEALPRVVLAGPPSAGKSTLFNALLGRTRAVISPTPGTTRDALAEPMTLLAGDGTRVEIMLVDIAGLDTATSALDAQAQAAARAAIDSADLLLSVDDGRQAGGASREITKSAAAALRVRTKADLPLAVAPAADAGATHDVTVSATTGQGLDALRSAIVQRLAGRAASLGAETLALQPRHHDELSRAHDRLAEAVGLLEPHKYARALDRPELIAAELRAALDRLACLGGEVAPDDVIGRVFATFCVGK